MVSASGLFTDALSAGLLVYWPVNWSQPEGAVCWKKFRCWRRKSAPNFRECLPCVQLRVSASWYTFSTIVSGTHNESPSAWKFAIWILVNPEELPPWFALGIPPGTPSFSVAKFVPKSRGRVASLNRRNPARRSFSKPGLKMWVQSPATLCTLLSRVLDVPEPNPPVTLGKLEGFVAMGVAIA